MSRLRFLIMHITKRSGHHRASCAIEEGLRHREPSVEVRNVDAFRFASPFIRWAIYRTYLSLIRHQPDVWEYLYDNPVIHQRVQYFRKLLNHYQVFKLKRLLEEFRPDAIVCTQAYPCGVAADFKQQHGIDIPLVGVLTDYAPHLYWFHDQVDAYVVPSEQVKRHFLIRGINASRIKVMGIPIGLSFLNRSYAELTARRFGLDLRQPTILIMGGGSGFGQICDMVGSLDIIPQSCQFIVLTGTNRRLLGWFKTRRFKHRVLALPYTNQVSALMDISTLLVSKPGGMTTAEALVKHLPLVMVNPIPGQESYNARFLLSQGAAIQASSPDTVRQTVRDLLENPAQLETIRRRMAELARPHASQDIADLLITLASRHRRKIQADGGETLEALSQQAPMVSRSLHSESLE